MTGKISRLVFERGFGFIKGDDGVDYFMHRSAVHDGDAFDQLQLGQTVTFDATRGEKGPRAENVRRRVV